MKLAGSLYSFAIAAILVVMPALSAGQQSGQSSGIGDLEPGWLESWQSEIDRQLDWFSSAYALSPDEIVTLRSELDARVLQQHEHEMTMKAEMAALAKKIEESGVSWEDEGSPLVQSYGQKFLEMTNRMPLNDDEVASWLGSRVPQARAAEGRTRLQELREKAQAEMVVARVDQELGSAKKGLVGKEIVGMNARVDPTYNRPVPTSDLGERVEAQDRLARVARNIEPTRGRRANSSVQPNAVPQIVPPPVTHQIPQQPAANADVARAAQTPAGPPRPVVAPSKSVAPPLVGGDAARSAKPEPPPQPAPPLDDWEKYVLTTADKYGFNDAQLTNARSILSDLRRRAYQYQASRAESFARVELMTDAKAREAEKKALNRPLDALFAELKVRLDSLPTQAQRQKAGPTPAKR